MMQSIFKGMISEMVFMLWIQSEAFIRGFIIDNSN
jgi:hypothetical protein